MNIDEEAQKLLVNDKHQVERATAQNSDIFSCVSDCVSLTAEKILGRKADYIFINGLDMKNFPDMGEIKINFDAEVRSSRPTQPDEKRLPFNLRN